MDRRGILCAALAAAVGFAVMPATAQLAEKPVRIVFPYAAGGNGDALSRLIAEELRKAINRPVVVENKTGAAGRLGVLEVVKAEKTGDTILITPIAPPAVHQHVFTDLPYNPDKDLVPITQICKFEFAIAVGPEVPAKTLKELVAWMKANPGKASFGTPGAGALPHFFGILFGKAVGIDFVHVGYRGSAPAIVDLLAGQIPIVVTTTSDLLAQHKAGKIRILATSDDKRSPLVPDVPTFKESGYDIVGGAWYAAYAPAGTPADVINRYAKIIAEAVQKPEMKERLLGLGLYSTGTTPEEFAKIHKADSAFWGEAVKISGFKPGK
ncbi:MAG TPA: Bug family tripartite tricarboxylate transporter substrate binding protein [Xanthobacteraceae bacterium]|nr:Bug family tripartite tricarboxylate transporter substrate binding protein [Xanthobacteraceae bacterium]